MKNKFIQTAIICVVLFLSNCRSSDIEMDLPYCIKTKIVSILANEVNNPTTQIWKWKVDDKTYYYITSNCCDQYNYLYNSNCEIVCAPDGGISGNGDGNCPSFTTEIQKTLVWEDPRD